MRTTFVNTALVTIGLALAAAAQSGSSDGLDAQAQAALEQAVANPARSEKNRSRDAYRHPVQTLEFFGIQPTMTVVEIWPGGGWYTEILAPYLAPKGRLIVAAPAGKGSESLAKRLDADPALFGKVERANFPTVLGGTGVAPGTADAVLTFRNVHNWGMGYLRPDRKPYSEEAFAELFAMLKPGGVLGIEDHRLPEDASAEREKSSGYIKVSTVRAERKPEGHDRLEGGRVDAATDLRPRRYRPREVRGDRRERPHDAEVHQAQEIGSSLRPRRDRARGFGRYRPARHGS